MTVIIDPDYAWRAETRGAARVWHIGVGDVADRVIDSILDGDGNFHPERVEAALSASDGPFALIVETPGHVFACVDRIRSFPVVYCGSGEAFRVSNSARKLKAEAQISEIDPLSRAEFHAAGYVTGSATLCRGLSQLQAGEGLVFDKKSGRLAQIRYYEFFPVTVNEDGDEALIARLGELTDAIFKRVIRRVNGAPVVVPLSGGLDSRLVVCKLKEFGCQNLKAFTFGSPGNGEMKIARDVAKKLGLDWRFVPSRCRAAKRLFGSEARRRYWEYADFLSSVPVMADFQALCELREDGWLPDDAVIINGQSGDFITGGHVPAPERFVAGSAVEFFDVLSAKHFRLWRDAPAKAYEPDLRAKALGIAGFEEGRDGGFQEWASRYELWEWQERQCKYVVNGQRKYDFLGLRWELPLWEKEYLEFWRDIPARRKAGQRLYKEYLDRNDFYGVFRGLKREVWRWPGISFVVPVLAQPVKWFLGRGAADAFYKYAAFFGYYRFYYAPYGLSHFLHVARRIRNPVSLHVERWLAENL